MSLQGVIQQRYSVRHLNTKNLLVLRFSGGALNRQLSSLLSVNNKKSEAFTSGRTYFRNMSDERVTIL